MPDHLFLRSSVYPFVCFFVCPSFCLSVSLSVGCPAMRERPFERESNLNLNRFRFLFFWPSQTSRKCFEDRTRFENTWKTDLRVSKRYWIQFKYFRWFNKKSCDYWEAKKTIVKMKNIFSARNCFSIAMVTLTGKNCFRFSVLNILFLLDHFFRIICYLLLFLSIAY